MNNGFEDIMVSAETLGASVSEHPRSRRYSSALDKMKADTRAQEVYARLVKLGKEITDVKDNSSELTEEFINENARLRDELLEFPVVTEFIESQKEYFEMMKAVQDKIRILS
jgi:cell fate (sporulation/competence/biofilm development) regulator YlbF (YheA/YmcA/DUF963 family)